ncbi:MAG TPA: succinate dehydrogenase assembly factor 2 [Magnetospirillaceae bacterium]|jgi:antitoxin CptB
MDPRRKRILFRARHMGTAENDILFGGFAEAHLAALDEAQCARFETLLEAADPDLNAWATGAVPAPPELNHDVMQLLQAYVRAGGGQYKS